VTAACAPHLGSRRGKSRPFTEPVTLADALARKNSVITVATGIPAWFTQAGSLPSRLAGQRVNCHWRLRRRW
jgi:hypothetical protein